MRKSILADRVFNRPLLLAAAKANILAPILAQEILGDDISFNPAEAVGEHFVPDRHAGLLGFSGPHLVGRTQEQSMPRTGNGVGLISVEGTLINKGGWIGAYSGQTSYQGLMRQISEARQDDSIKAAVFEYDSYGGEVAGCADCGAAIADLSREKPTLAICTDHAYSAAYWLASQCRNIVLPAAGGVGSIGVIMMHANIAPFLKKQGTEITIINAGDHKADGHPYDALPESVREKWLADAEFLRKQFVEAVSLGRGDRLNVADALATEADTFMGEVAVEVGLADFVARPSEAFTGFVEQF